MRVAPTHRKTALSGLAAGRYSLVAAFAIALSGTPDCSLGPAPSESSRGANMEQAELREAGFDLDVLRPPSVFVVHDGASAPGLRVGEPRRSDLAGASADDEGSE